jgi:hypothetical protein
MLLITSATTVAVAWIKVRLMRKPTEEEEAHD